MNRKSIDRLEPRRLLAILYVDLHSPIGTNNGSSWGNAFHDLHEALTVANSGDTIRVADGTYKPTSSDDRAIAFQLKSGVGLFGGYAGHGAINPDARDFINTATILSGEIGSSASDDNSYNVLKGEELAELVTIDGFTVTQTWGGTSSEHGAIKVNEVNLIVRNLNAISNNLGIRFDSDFESYGEHELQVLDSNFSLNAGGVGFESYMIDNPKLLVDNCTFTQNTGSGLWVSDTYYDYMSPYGPDGVAAVIRSSHFDGNGSGAYVEGGAGIFDCTFNNNAGTGLGIYTGLVANSELNDNGSSAMYFEQYVTVINTDFIRNNGHAASWFKGGSFTNCRFIGNTQTVLIHHENSDSTGSGVYGCLFVGNPVGPALRTGAISRSVFIGNGTAISIGNHLEYSPTIPIRNNTFFGNTADVGSVLSYPYSADTQVIFDRNIAWSNGGSPDIVLTHNGYPDDPPQIVKDSIIDEGYPHGTNISTVDPQFIEEPSPGADNVWGTEDDDYGDLHLREDSPAIDWGYGAYADNGEPDVTLVGNEYVLTGTDGNDTISVARDDDFAPYASVIWFGVNGNYINVIAESSHGVRINSKGGNDRVTANGSIPFTLDGGSGNDTLRGGNDADILIGGAGDDELIGYSANDTIFAGDGNDLVNGSDGTDIIHVNNTVMDGYTRIQSSTGYDHILVGTAASLSTTAIFQATQRINTLTIGAKGIAQTAFTGEHVLTLSGLSIDPLGQFDITNTSVIFDHAPNANPIDFVKSKITAGYNNGSWNGNGIISSTSAQNNRTAVGYAASTALFETFPATFRGQNVDENAIIISHTLKGDVNLDRVVDFNDLLRVAQHYGSNFALWSHGDFNYDYAVDFNDLLSVAQNYSASWALLDSMNKRKKKEAAQ